MLEFLVSKFGWICDAAAVLVAALFSALLHIIFKDIILTVAGAFIIYYFVRSLLRFWKKITPVADGVKKANKVLNFENHEQYFYENYEKVSAQLEAIPTMQHHWQEFKEHLILPTEAESTEKEATQLKVKNSLPPSFFFSEEKFIERPIDLRYIDSVPGKLVALGVLFTFVGLSIGIYSATHTLGGLGGQLDTPELNNALMKLLSGASLAFITSVGGISFSLLFSWFEKRKIKNVKKSLNSFVDSIEKCMFFVTSEQIHLEIRDATVEQNRKLDGFSNELAIAIGNSVAKSISTPLNEVFTKMADNIEELKNIQQNFSEKLMQDLIDKISGNVLSQAQQNQQQAAATFTGVQQAFAQQTETMLNAQKEADASSQKLLRDINASNKHSQEQMQQQLTNMLEQFREMTTDTTSELQKNIVASSQQMGQEMQDAFGNVVASMNRQQQEISNSIKNVTDSITKGADKMNEAITSFEKLIVTNTANIEENNRIQSSYQDITARQQDVVEKFSAISQTIESASADISAASQENKSIANVFSDAVGQVETALQKMNEMWQAYDQKFKDTDETMSKNFNHFERCTQQFHQTVEQYVTNLTREFQKAIGTLSEMLDELSETRGDKDRQ